MGRFCHRVEGEIFDCMTPLAESSPRLQRVSNLDSSKMLRGRNFFSTLIRCAALCNFVEKLIVDVDEIVIDWTRAAKKWQSSLFDEKFRWTVWKKTPKSFPSLPLRYLIALSPFIKRTRQIFHVLRGALRLLLLFVCCLLPIQRSPLNSAAYKFTHQHPTRRLPPCKMKAWINRITANFRLDDNPFRLLID